MTHLIVFSHLRWGFVYQRPQHLLSRLARHYQVHFIEEPLYVEGGEPQILRQPQSENLEVLVPQTPVRAPGFHDDQLPVLEPLVRRYLAEHGIEDYVVWFYTPMALPLMAKLQPRAVVYDCMDELSAFRNAPRQLRQRESALLRRADVVFTGGPAIYEAKRDAAPNVHCMPSSVDARHFSPARLDPASQPARDTAELHLGIEHPRLGFYGVIDERLDLALLEAVAEARPDWQLVMAGPVVKIDPESLPRRPNIHWLGMQPYERLPYLVAGWDVCLMPFALNESTRFISPTKTLEYLAGEKPVVSTAVHDVLVLYGDVVRIANGPMEFVQACEETLDETLPQRGQREVESLAVVSSSSWDRTASSMMRLLEEALDRQQATSVGAAAQVRAVAG